MQAKVIPFPVQQQEKQPSEKRVVKRKAVDEFNLPGHLFLGALMGLYLAHHPLGFALVLFGSLLPDIDHPRSTLGRYNLLARFRFCKHRGHCHSLIGVVLLCLPFLIFGVTPYLLVLAGCASHLAGDMLAGYLPKHRKFMLKLW